MSENFPIEIRDTENNLLERYNWPKLIDPSLLVEVLENFRRNSFYQIEEGRSLQITQWMPDKKGHITIGEGY